MNRLQDKTPSDKQIHQAFREGWHDAQRGKARDWTYTAHHPDSRQPLRDAWLRGWDAYQTRETPKEIP